MTSAAPRGASAGCGRRSRDRRADPAAGAAAVLGRADRCTGLVALVEERQVGSLREACRDGSYLTRMRRRAACKFRIIPTLRAGMTRMADERAAVKTLPRPRAAPGRSARHQPAGRRSYSAATGCSSRSARAVTGASGSRATRNTPAPGRGQADPARHATIPQERLRIEREGRAAARLVASRRSSRCTTSATIASAHYLVSELVEGASLARALPRARGVADRDARWRSASRSPTRSSTRTSAASCIATSSRRT